MDEPVKTVVTEGLLYTFPGHHPWPKGAEVPLPESHANDHVAAGAVKHKEADAPAA